MRCRKCGCEIDGRTKLSKEKHVCRSCAKYMKTLSAKKTKTIKKTKAKKIQRGG